MGASCSADEQCAGGNCVDGFCCNTSACPLCQACNVPSKEGTCSFVGTGIAEPHNACTANGICGNTGACAANQTCAKAPSSTMCGSASCTAGTEKQAAFCDGVGNCSPAASKACDPFVCGTNACKDTCVTDFDCIPGDYCKNGLCNPKLSPGTTCGPTDECLSGVCGAEGVCCDSDCSGTCVSCKRPTSPGTCKPLDAGTACGPASCADTVFTGNACDGAGMCQPTTVDCATTSTPTCDPTQGCI